MLSLQFLYVHLGDMGDPHGLPMVSIGPCNRVRMVAECLCYGVDIMAFEDLIKQHQADVA
jgi:hypothetical protein